MASDGRTRGVRPVRSRLGFPSASAQRRALIALCALAASLLVAPASPSARAARTPSAAQSQLTWVLDSLNSATVPSSATLARHFAPAFLKAVPPAALVQALAPLIAERPLRVVSTITTQGQFTLVVRVATASGASFSASIVVLPTGTHQIEGLLFKPLPAPLTSWTEIDHALRRLGASASLYAGVAGGVELNGVAASSVGAIGSAFKLYVLGALAAAVERGTARWNELLAINDAWKSLPSGAMRSLPAGARFTLLHYAEQMISVSDNTAADHLIHLLGRRAVETQLSALGNRSPSRDEPFLTTRELFALKLAAPASLRDAFAAANTHARRALLARVDALTPTLAEATDWTSPREIERLEWFASPAELATAMTRLVGEAARPGLAPLRTILSLNPGVELDRSLWRYVAYKGGSEPGVLSLTWYLRRNDGHAFVLSIIVNDPHRDIDTFSAVTDALAAIALLAHAR